MTSPPNTSSEPWTVGRLLTWTTEHFTRNGVDEPRLSAEVLLAHALGCARIALYTKFETQPDADKTAIYRDLVKRAAAREPIAYLVGQKEFFSLTFAVTSDVLIPRPETETLVERAIQHCASAGLEAPVLLDVGTGSGCIPIAILSQLKGARAVATDISRAALDIARANADRHKLADRVEFIEADGLTLPSSAIPDGGFELIVSNPPYISQGEMESLAPNVRDFEPRAALTDEGDGLSFYRAIASGAAKILREDGLVLVEIADGQQDSVRDTMVATGMWTHAGTWKDSVTRNPRVVAFQRKS